MENDEAYANADFIPDGAAYPDRWRAASDAFRKDHGDSLGIAYGDEPRQTYDLFMPDGAPEGVLIFVHGGYWMKFGPEVFSHLAAGPLARGWAVAMPSYPLAPEARIADITLSIARAVDAIAERLAGSIILAGHSAGGHLVSRMGNDDVELEARDRIRRIVPISPLSDLAPLMATSMNADLRIDAVEALLESPARRQAPACPVSIWVGEAERPAFLHQARMLSRLWCADLVIDPERHHFDIIEALTDPETPLTRTVTTIPE